VSGPASGWKPLAAARVHVAAGERGAHVEHGTRRGRNRATMARGTDRRGTANRVVIETNGVLLTLKCSIVDGAHSASVTEIRALMAADPESVERWGHRPSGVHSDRTRSVEQVRAASRLP